MEFLLHQTEDGINRISMRVEVECRLLPGRPSRVAPKKGSNDAA
jgi:hypothetical protein